MFVRTLIADFSHVYTDMGFIDKLKKEGCSLEVVDLSSVEGTTCYCSPDAEDRIREQVAPFSDFPIRWIDSVRRRRHVRRINLRFLIRRGLCRLLRLSGHPDP